MTLEKVVKVLEEMERRVPQVARVRCSPVASDVSAGAKARHAAWMIGECYAMIADGKKIEKIMRWLGFVQGVAWAMGWFTIEQLKNMNKPEDK